MQKLQDHLPSIHCGVTLTLASIFARIALEDSSYIYQTYDTLFKEFSKILTFWTRIMLISFAYIIHQQFLFYKKGSISMVGLRSTILLSLTVNLIFGGLWDWHVYGHKVNLWQLLGIAMIMIGLLVILNIQREVYTSWNASKRVLDTVENDVGEKMRIDLIIQ
jgi:drug/metabolite transporter superfamily protein YnfA